MASNLYKGKGLSAFGVCNIGFFIRGNTISVFLIFNFIVISLGFYCFFIRKIKRNQFFNIQFYYYFLFY